MCTQSYVQWPTPNSAPKHRHGKSSVAKTTRCFWRVFWGFRQKRRQGCYSHDKNFSWLDWLLRSDLLLDHSVHCYNCIIFSSFYLKGENLTGPWRALEENSLIHYLRKLTGLDPSIFLFWSRWGKACWFLHWGYLWVCGFK